MHDEPTNRHKIDETLTPRATTVSPVRQIFVPKSLVVTLGGLGLGLMVVGLFDYPGQSTTSDSDKPLPASVTEVATNNDAPNHNCDRQARAAMAAANAAVSEAKRAIILSQADVAQADINIQTFKAKYDRELELHRQGAVNSQLSQARVAYDFGKQQKQIAIEGLKHAQGQLTETVSLVKTRSPQLARAGDRIR
jgi:hypothetical protein